MQMRMAIGITLALSIFGTAAQAEQTPAKDQRSVSSAKARPAKVAANGGRQTHETGRTAARANRETRDREAEDPPQDEYIGPMQVVGKREIGSAAWYGGPLIGRRTASGDRLDAVRATAAHRSLPLATLVRVTNLTNGRSVIAKITDRGPVSRARLIDVSPAVADKLDMRRAGVAHVSVEPVAPVPRTVH
jgi:rare lipoprotein A